VINHASQAPDAARGMRFPVIIKPNIGGSGVGIVRFGHSGTIGSGGEEWNRAGARFDRDRQEFIPARGGHITRVRPLVTKYLYGIKVFTSGETFDLWPDGHLQDQRRRG